MKLPKLRIKAMGNSPDKAEDTAVLRAIEWHTRLQSPELTDECVVEFEAWLRADPAHLAEFRRIDDLWHDLEGIDKYIDRGAVEAMVDGLRTDARRERRARGASLGGGFWATRRGALAASGAVAVLLAVLGIGVFPLAQKDGRYETALGERRSVELADGSIVLLNTRTTIDVAYSDEERRIVLETGQATFDVRSDQSRPFFVVAGNGIVQALGTEFDVYKSNGTTTVTLLEGRVAVHQLASIPDQVERPPPTSVPMARPSVELRPGEQVSLVEGENPVKVANVDVDVATAWQDGKIILQDARLDAAIADVNRYSRTKISLAEGDGLEELQVSGIFFAGKSESFADAVADYFDLHVYRFGDRIVLRRPARI